MVKDRHSWPDCWIGFQNLYYLLLMPVFSGNVYKVESANAKYKKWVNWDKFNNVDSLPSDPAFLSLFLCQMRVFLLPYSTVLCMGYLTCTNW